MDKEFNFDKIISDIKQDEIESNKTIHPEEDIFLLKFGVLEPTQASEVEKHLRHCLKCAEKFEFGSELIADVFGTKATPLTMSATASQSGFFQQLSNSFHKVLQNFDLSLNVQKAFVKGFVESEIEFNVNKISISLYQVKNGIYVYTSETALIGKTLKITGFADKSLELQSEFIEHNFTKGFKARLFFKVSESLSVGKENKLIYEII